MSRFSLLSVLLLPLLCASLSSAQFSVSTIRTIVQCTECASPCLDVMVPIYPDFSNEGMLISDIGSLAAAACAGPYKFQSISTGGSDAFLFNNTDPAALVLMDSAIIYDTNLQPSVQSAEEEEEEWKRMQRPEESAPTAKRMLPRSSSKRSRWSAPPQSHPSHHALFAPDNSCTFSRYVPCTLVLQLDCLYSSASSVPQYVPLQLTPSMLVSEVVSYLSSRCGTAWPNVTIVIDSSTMYTADNKRLAADVFRSEDYVTYNG